MVLPAQRSRKRRRAQGPAKAAFAGALTFWIAIAAVSPLAAQTKPGGATSERTAPLTLVNCAANPAATCAVLSLPAAGPAEIELSDGQFTLIDAQLMGGYDIAGATHQLAYVYAETNGEQQKRTVSVFIIDLTVAKRIASVSSPGGYDAATTYFSYIRGPRGEKHPFIAAGAHYLSDRPSPTDAFAASPWNFLCLFDAARIADPDPRCATGFKSYGTSFTTPDGARDVDASGFRHGGGWVEDVDGDGWDDINLPFLQYILTISGKTGRLISLAHFDVAARVEPNSPPYFHSGRFYGRFTTFVEPDTGRHDVLFTDGEGAGYFGGLYCGVSRFVAVAQWAPGPSLQLKWSDYLSFAKTIFKPPYLSAADVERVGDDLNKCPHFFATGLEWLNGRPLVVFSLFVEDEPAPACQAELFAEQKSGFQRAASAAYETQCAPKEIPAAAGRWSVHFIDALTGRELAEMSNAYIWGEAKNLVPGKPHLLLLQRFPGERGVPYNRTADAVDNLALAELVDGPSLQTVAGATGSLAAPVVTGVLEYGKYGNMGGGPAYPPGTGSSYEGIPQLVTKDIDGDGFGDIELANGKWLGYSARNGGLVVKSAPPPEAR